MKKQLQLKKKKKINNYEYEQYEDFLWNDWYAYQPVIGWQLRYLYKCLIVFLSGDF